MRTKITIADGSVYIEGRGLNRWKVDDDSIVSPYQDVISAVVVNDETVPLTPGVDHSVTVTYGPPAGRPSKLSIKAKAKKHADKVIRISGIQRTSQVRRGPKWVAIGDNLLYCGDPEIRIRKVTVDGDQVYNAKADTTCKVTVQIAAAELALVASA